MAHTSTQSANELTSSNDDARRSALSRDEIVDTALAIVAEEGLSAVTMRRLADRIGVTPMALYHHVPNKSDLLDLAVNQVGRHLKIARDGRHWTEQIRSYALEWRDELHRFPGVAGYLMHQNAPPTMSWRIIDDATSVMMEAGLDERQAARAFAGLVSFVLARCDQEERMGLLDPQTSNIWNVEELRQDMQEEVPDLHPHVDVNRVAMYLGELSADEHFTYMLDRILVGIDAERH